MTRRHDLSKQMEQAARELLELCSAAAWRWNGPAWAGADVLRSLLPEDEALACVQTRLAAD
jgi:hypothetical protein